MPVETQITLRLVGHMEAISQLATSPPNTPAVTPAATRKSNPPTPLPRLSRLVQNSRRLVPYFPAAGLRGKLRRKAEELVRLGLVGEGSSPFNLLDHFYLALGGIKGEGEEDKYDVLDAARRRAGNPLIGLFGSAVPWAQGRLFVSHAVPTEDVTVDVVRGMRSDEFKRDPEKIEILSAEDKAEWLALASNSSDQARRRAKLKAERITLIRKLDAAEPDKKIELNERLTEIEAELGELTSVSAGLPLAGFEAIPIGTILEQSFTLSNVSRLEAGLFLAALDHFAREPLLGAHLSLGCGQVGGAWAASLREDRLGSFRPFGSATIKPFDGLELSEELAALRDAFLAWLPAQDPASFRAPKAA